jgi:hypothetical protein
VEADRLGIEIGLFNCPGWSQSGGPWITPDRSMRNLVSTELRVTGPTEFSGPLPGRDGYFETVRVLAFPTPTTELVTMADAGVRVSGPPQAAPPNPFVGGSVGFRAALRFPGDPGNPTGTVRSLTLSNGQGEILFDDDFSDGLTKWQGTEGAEVSEEGLRPLSAENPLLTASEVSLPERFALETRVRLRAGGVLGLAFAVKNNANQAFWQLRQGQLRPHIKVEDRFEILEIPVPALSEEEWLTVTIASDGTRVTTHINGQTVHELPIVEVRTGQDLQALFDLDQATSYRFPRGIGAANPFVLDFTFAEPFPVQSVIADPVSGSSGLTGRLLASADGVEFREVCGLDMHHGHQGVKVADPIVAPVFTELALSSQAVLDKYVIKQLGDIHPTPHPVYGTYEWPLQAEPELEGSVLAPENAIDLTDRTDEDGELHWSVPEGNWTIARFGMVSTGSRNGPAMPDATGLECDKMNADHIRFHFDHYIGEVLQRIPAENRRSFRYIIQDSYEQGPQNWTDGLIATFQARYGYDPVPYLPVTTGRIVGSADRSERFLWDLRRLVADLIGTEYVGGITRAAEENGLLGWLENYGHWGFPGESLIYGKHSSQVGGEFWLESTLGTLECRMPASCAHVYGKRDVFAEAFTSGIKYIQTPQSHFKHYGDWAFCEGVNHFILHVYFHQPRTGERPGVDAPFGTGFHRNNTWFPQLSGFTDYTRRLTWMMRRGSNVADVCYFIGEGSPKMDGPRTPRLPRGYDFDFVNGDVVLNRLQVRDGRMAIPDGPAYKVMVLPPVETMRPEIARRLLEFVEGGAVVVGPRPVRSPSLQDYPECDRELARLTDELWGKGRITATDDLTMVLAGAGVEPDFAYSLDDAEADSREDPYTDLSYAAQPQRNSLRFAHRRDGDTDIYFVANMQTDRGFGATCTFRVGHKLPEIWDPVTGEVRVAGAFTRTGTGVTLPVHFAPKQSLVFVFRQKTERDGSGTSNTIDTETVLALDRGWEVRFDPERGGPGSVRFETLTSWTERPEEGVRYFSGEAVYETDFTLEGQPRGRTWLDLGAVADTARVVVNGQDLGIAWVEPWRVEVTGALREGANHLQIRVANTWNNRIYGDQQGGTRYARFYTPYHTGRLLPAGLLGPVRVVATPE